MIEDGLLLVTCNSTAWNRSQELGELAPLSTLLAGVTVFLLILPIVLFEFRVFPIGTTSAVMLGAALMVVTQVVPSDEVYAVIGQPDHMTTIFLLLGMMLLAQYFEREELLVRLLRRILLPSQTFENYIWRIALLSFVLSALFTNDACCAILTPLLLKFWEAQERPHNEVETITLAIATSANIGSVLTIFGNPQMALIASRTSMPLFQKSRLDLRTCLFYLGPPALIAFFLNLVFLILNHHLKTRHIEKSKLISETSQSDQEMAGLTNDLNSKGKCDGLTQANGHPKLLRDDLFYDGSSQQIVLPPCQLETILEDEVLEITSIRRSSNDSDENEIPRECIDCGEFVSQNEDVERGNDDTSSEEDEEAHEHHNSADLAEQLKSLNIEYKPSVLQPSQSFMQAESTPKSSRSPPQLQSYQLSERFGISRSPTAVSACDFLVQADVVSAGQICHDASFMPSDSIIFQGFLVVILAVVISLFLASTPRLHFDLGLVPMGAAVLVIVIDALLNRRNANLVIKRVDWSILMMFFGVFVWMHGFSKTHLPQWVWAKINIGSGNDLLRPTSIAPFFLFVVIGSNIFSNVPLTLIILEQLVPCEEELALVLMLAWCATIAGNLTLFGSVANLIVAQKSQQTVRYNLTFFTYLRYGFLTTLVILITGVLIIYGLLHI